MKKLIAFHSVTGNTKSIVELSDVSGYEVVKLTDKTIAEIDFSEYDVIFLGASTWGKGVPSDFYKNNQSHFEKILNKRIVLFGSGNTHYLNFCGALDILKDFFSKHNKVEELFMFESYPTKEAQDDFQKLLDKYNEEDDFE